TLVNDLLSLATHENSGEAFEDEVRIDEVLWEIQEEMSRAFPDKKLEFNLDELPENPDLLTVHGNQGYLKRAIGNIVNNALKYSDGKPVEMAVSSSDHKVHIRVKDNGIGIEKADLMRIFQPFYRGSNARQLEGHGIGLSLAMSVFQMHNGTVNIDSAPGQGTTVDIALPTV
ncbi:MAG: HAMP domain-containing histidine kinase, partial [Sphingobacteriales bacterium]